MKMLKLIPSLLALGLPPLLTAATLVNESFDKLPSPAAWKISGAEVAGGNLMLKAEGNEAGYVGTSIQTMPPLAGLNFSRASVKITLSDINLTGPAAPEKQAFALLLGSDKASEIDAAGYVRLCINGDGKAILSILVRKEGGNSDKPVIVRSVAFPIKKLTLTLDRQGCTLEIVDGPKPQTATEKWTDQIDWSVWENATPALIVKGVRRPAPGACVASLGALTIESK